MSENSFSVDSSCRFCGNQKGTFDSFTNSITAEKVLLHEAFVFVTCVEILDADDYPSGICIECMQRLEDAYLLKKQALNLYEKFQEYKSKNDETISNYCGKDDEDDVKNVKIEIIETEEEILEEEDSLSESNYVDSATDAVEFLSNESKLSADNVPLTRKQRKSFTQNDKKHICQVCQKRFLRKSNLVDHLRLHANVKPFQCEYCEKAFVQSGNYKSHIRIHTNEKPFVCPICSKAYNQSSALKIHIRVHTNERNYVCPVCSKAFTNSSDLTKHKRVHDPSTQFKCTFCKRTFAQKANLKLHQNNVHHDKIIKLQT